MIKQTKKWTMLDGKKIRICDMSDNHLDNTIKMLVRGAQSKVRYLLDQSFAMESMLQGEQASLSVQTAQERLMDEDSYQEYLPDIYWNLVNEQRRRDERD